MITQSGQPSRLAVFVDVFPLFIYLLQLIYFHVIGSKMGKEKKMGKKNKKKISKKKNVDNALPSYSWMGEDGMHVMTPGDQPSPEQLEEMTRMFSG